MSRFTQDQEAVVARFFQKLATTSNKTGKMLESKKAKIMASWEVFPVDVVIEALETYIKMDIPQAQNGKGKNEKYVLGIMKNKAGEWHGKHSPIVSPTTEDEGGRLGKIIASGTPTPEDLQCDF